MTSRKSRVIYLSSFSARRMTRIKVRLAMAFQLPSEGLASRRYHSRGISFHWPSVSLPPIWLAIVRQARMVRTRTFDLYVAVSDPELWSGYKERVEQLLRFLTTDLWTVSFLGGGLTPEPHPKAKALQVDATVLLSGGLDSLIGAIDRGSTGKKLIAVSHIVRGDGAKQETFANGVPGVKKHLHLPHAADIPNAETPASQRSRSLMYLAYGVLAATSTAGYRDGQTVDLYVCENGFIALNPPLTPARVGARAPARPIQLFSLTSVRCSQHSASG